MSIILFCYSDVMMLMHMTSLLITQTPDDNFVDADKHRDRHRAPRVYGKAFVWNVVVYVCSLWR